MYELRYIATKLYRFGLHSGLLNCGSGSVVVICAYLFIYLFTNALGIAHANKYSYSRIASSYMGSEVSI